MCLVSRLVNYSPGQWVLLELEDQVGLLLGSFDFVYRLLNGLVDLLVSPPLVGHPMVCRMVKSLVWGPVPSKRLFGILSCRLPLPCLLRTHFALGLVCTHLFQYTVYLWPFILHLCRPFQSCLSCTFPAPFHSFHGSQYVHRLRGW